MKDHMKDVADELMEAAEACVAEATPATLEPEKLQLVKGEFSSLEDALRAQIQKMEADLLAAKWRSAQAKIERDEWRSKYEQKVEADSLANSILVPSIDE